MDPNAAQHMNGEGTQDQPAQVDATLTAPTRRPYQTPVLTRHGSVFQLTQKAGACPSHDLLFGDRTGGGSGHSKC